MRMHRLGFGLIGTGLVVAPGHSVSAAVFATMNLNQEVFAVGNFPVGPPSGVNQVVSSTTVPIQQTVSLDNLTGGKITTTYSVSDDGNVATFDINSTGALSALGNTIGDMNSFSGPMTSFSFSQPVFYQATITDTGPGDANITAYGVPDIQLATFSNSTAKFTGTTQGIISLRENWTLSNYGLGSQYTNRSGTNSVAFTFTAIPEPSTAALIIIPAAAFLIRRSRRSTSPNKLRVSI